MFVYLQILGITCQWVDWDFFGKKICRSICLFIYKFLELLFNELIEIFLEKMYAGLAQINCAKNIKSSWIISNHQQQQHKWLQTWIYWWELLDWNYWNSSKLLFTVVRWAIQIKRDKSWQRREKDVNKSWTRREQDVISIYCIIRINILW